MRKEKGVSIKFALTFCVLFLCFGYAINANSQNQNSNAQQGSEIIVESAGYAFKPPYNWSVDTSGGKILIEFKGEQNQGTQIIIIAEPYDRVRSLNPNATSNPSILFDETYKNISPQITAAQKKQIQIGNKIGYTGGFENSDFLHLKNLNSNTEAEQLVNGKLAVTAIDDKRFLMVIGFVTSGAWTYDNEFDSLLNSVRILRGVPSQSNGTRPNEKTQTPKPKQQPKKENKVKKAIKDIFKKPS